MYRILLLVALVSASYGYSIRPLAEHSAPLPIPTAGRIVGGVETNIEDVPYQVTLLLITSLLCGGSIVKPRAIVTAAHCTIIGDTEFPVSSIVIRAGSSNYNSSGQLIQSSHIFRHELYHLVPFDSDIAIVELASAISFGASAAPIALPSQGLVVPDGSIALTSGWGQTEMGSLSPIIRKVQIPIVNQNVCNEAYTTTFGISITSGMICAGEEGKDACNGDSGGPLVVDDTLVGVTAFLNACGLRGFPGVWTRVSSFRTWLTERLNQIE